MDMDLIVIFTFILLAASLVFAMAHKFHQRTVEHEERKLELKARIAEAKAQESNGREDVMQHLEDRMRVIERIVTDPGADLSRQIENLRHDRKAREEAES
jgi:hypothetical protein